jgi:hypothetical protein
VDATSSSLIRRGWSGRDAVGGRIDVTGFSAM